jgi:pyrimidine deaminase RibD-like protein
VLISTGFHVESEDPEQDQEQSANKVMDEDRQRQFMHLALLEGRKALPSCTPNPPVGCVLVRQGIVVASGHTSPPGGKHAEAMALSLLSGQLTDVTAFVTLEPCSFHGRTPSCAEELVLRKVGRVFISILDPDTRNNGAGVKILKCAGIEVSVGLLEEIALQELGPYLARKDNVPL